MNLNLTPNVSYYFLVQYIYIQIYVVATYASSPYLSIITVVVVLFFFLIIRVVTKSEKCI